MNPSVTAGADYRPLNLDALYNCPTELLEDAQEVRLGERTLHGLPFRFAHPDAASTLLLLEQGQPATSLALNSKLRWLIFAHAVLEPHLYDGAPVGMPCAQYSLHYADGSRLDRPLRQRFEIGPTPRKWQGRAIPLDWGQTPFLALNDAQHQLMDRCCGRYDAAGARLVEVDDPQARVPYVLPYRFYLWALENPQPEKTVACLHMQASGCSVIVAAVTLSTLPEDPFGREVSREVLLQLQQGTVDETVEIKVDRGFASYTHRLAAGSLEKDCCFPKGWGAAHGRINQGYARIAAVPSATLSLYVKGELLGQCRWQQLLQQGEVALGGQARLRLPAADRVWVRTRFIDADSGEQLPCRVHFRTLDGIPLAPYGHPPHIHSDGNTWNLDIGGDVRLGRQTYAYVNGCCEGWLPLGQVIVEVARGFEYQPVAQLVDIRAQQEELLIRLQRISNLRAQGWYSGDTHVHFVSTQGAELEARAEDVNVVNLLLSQWGHTYSSTEEFTGKPHVSAGGDTVVYACQENRTNMLGHINLLGLRQSIMPWCTGGSEEADLGGGLETTLSHWADECHAQGGTVILAHFPVPNGEAAALIATQRLDAVEMIAWDAYNVQEYYRYLNCGYRLPLVAGTDKMTSEVPIGLMRTYVHCPRGFSYSAWCEGIKHGACFVSSGPLLEFTVEGAGLGEELCRCRNKTLTLKARVKSIFPLGCLEIVANGKVIAQHRPTRPTSEICLSVHLQLRQDTWATARCYGTGENITRHHDVWQRPLMAHSSPIYLACGEQYQRFDAQTAQYMLALIEGATLYVEQRARRFWPGSAHHRHGQADHLGFLLEPLEQARAAVQQRIHQQR